MKILADMHIPYLKGVGEQLGEMDYLPGNQFTREAIKDKDALIVRTVTRFDESILSGSKVKLICSATIGFDHIDTAYCDSQGIAWRTAPGCNATSVEQYVTASLLYLSQKYNFDLSEKTIGIVGVGNVGSKVVVACEKLGIRALLNDPPREEREGKGAFTDIDIIKKEADIITFHTPLTKSGDHPTYHIGDETFFNEVARRPFIINAARGGVIDNRSLAEAMRDGKVAGAVIDCWENEPDIDRELLALVDIATPHVAGYSADGKWNATRMSLDNLNSFFGLNKELVFMDIPLPDKTEIDLKGIKTEEQLRNAVWRTYNPMKETDALKSYPDDFYRFRSHYPLRREYKAYTVVNADAVSASILSALGFNIR